jgi:hypothetical protein
VAKSLFFLRLLCPLLVTAEDGIGGRLSDRAMRAHVLLAKLLQSVANETPPFGKESYMQPLNAWVDSAIPSMRRFFKLALVRDARSTCIRRSPSTQRSVENDPLEVNPRLRRLYAVPNPTATEDARFLTNYVRRNGEKIRAALFNARAYGTLDRLAQHLPAPAPLEGSPSDTSSSSSSPRAPLSPLLSRKTSDRQQSPLVPRRVFELP